MRSIVAALLLLLTIPTAPAQAPTPGAPASAGAAASAPAEGAAVLPHAPAALGPALRALRNGSCGSLLDTVRNAASHPGPDGARAAYLLGRCLEAGGRDGEAARAYLDAAARHESLSARARVRAAQAALRAGDASWAAAVARPAAGASAVTAARLRLVRSEALRRLGAYQEAAAEARRAAETRWESTGPYLDAIQAESWWLVARASEAAGNLPEARSAYAMAWWAFPGQPRSADAFRRLRALSPTRAPMPTPQARAVRALRLLERWESDAAEHELTLAVASPLPPVLAAEAWYRLGVLRLGTGGAVGALEQAVRFPQDRDRALFWLGLAQLRAGRRQASAATWAQLRAAYPRSLWTARALATRARLAEGADRWQEADGLYRLVIERYPASPRADEARWRRAWMRYARGRRAEARMLFLRYGAESSGAPRAAAHLYWGARLTPAGQEAAARFREAAERYPLTFYGQRARQRLGLPAPPAPAAPRLRTLSPDRFDQAYAELAALSSTQDALEELEGMLTDDAPPAVREAAAVLYARSGDPARAVAVLEPLMDRAWSGERFSQAFWRAAFPRPFWEVVAGEARAHGVDPLLVLALMREESRFEPRAVSPAQAVGLMQLLPSTARGMLGGPVSAADLKQPALNIRGGTAYLARLLGRYGGSVPLAVAAYNAGPNGVRRHADLARSDLDRFVEEHPYAETRAYVQRVLQSYGIYRWLYR